MDTGETIPPYQVIHCQTCQTDIKASRWEIHISSKAHDTLLNPSQKQFIRTERPSILQCTLCHQSSIPADQWERHIRGKKHRENFARAGSPPASLNSFSLEESQEELYTPPSLKRPAQQISESALEREPHQGRKRQKVSGKCPSHSIELHRDTLQEALHDAQERLERMKTEISKTAEGINELIDLEKLRTIDLVTRFNSNDEDEEPTTLEIIQQLLTEGDKRTEVRTFLQRPEHAQIMHSFNLTEPEMQKAMLTILGIKK
jgi:predicted CopG family antitoxin